MGQPPIFLAMWVIDGKLTSMQAEYIWNNIRGTEIPHNLHLLISHLEYWVNLAKQVYP